MKGINLFLGSSIFLGYPGEYSFVDMLKEDYLLLRDKRSKRYFIKDKEDSSVYKNDSDTIKISDKGCFYNDKEATLSDDKSSLTINDGSIYKVSFYKGNDNVVKRAVNGTTLAFYTPQGASDDDFKYKSYLYRLTNDCMDIEKVDNLFIQLSTNDCNQIIKNRDVLGEIQAKEHKEIAYFNKATTLGAIEYIIEYAKIRWGCRVIFIACPYINWDNDYSKCYDYLVDKLSIIKDKWNIDVIDLCSDKKIRRFITKADDQTRKIYQLDDRLHFTKKGYEKFFYPAVRKYIDKQ